MKEKEILLLKELTVGYDTRKVVSEINQRINKGQFVSIIGPNGSGKTTILKTISRIISPLEGTVYIDGDSLDNLSSKECAKKMAVVLTERPRPGLLTGFEFVSLGRYPYTDIFGRLSKKDIKIIKEALDLVEAGYLSNRYFGELSDGEKQKLIIARAIAQEPKLILLDEPTLHLDLKNRIEVLNILHELSRKKGITIIASIHEIDIAFKMSDIIMLVKNGKIIGAGPPEKIIDEKKITSLYGLKNVCFSSKLYSIELKRNNNNKEKLFIVAGAGTGSPVYRFLSRHGYNLITGILHKDDLDYHIATNTALMVIYEKAFEKIGKNKFKEAISYLNNTNYVIDTGFPVGFTNKENIDLIQTAIKMHKKVFSLRKQDDAKRYFGIFYKNIIYLDGINSILEKNQESKTRI